MPRFFTDDISGDTARIAGDDARHIAKVLRMRVNEAVTVCDMRGVDYECALLEITPELVIAKILEKCPCISEPSAKIRLYQALPKGDKLEFITQKAVELGACEIIPVITSRCVSRWDEKSVYKKIERLQKIAHEAAKQSGRGIIPNISGPLSFEKAVIGMKTAERAILFYEQAKTPLREALTGKESSIAVMVGSEGGFSPEEAAFAQKNGVSAVSLGTRILRCETAPVAALAVISFICGEF